MKLDGKGIICVRMLFFTIIQFLGDL